MSNIETVNDTEWANGCKKCKYGIVSAPALTGATELYLERLAQFINGDIQFCDCQAGSRYRVYLMNRNQFLVEEARQKTNLSFYAAKGSHPDIEQALNAVQGEYFKAPPIHWEDDDKPVPEAAVSYG